MSTAEKKLLKQHGWGEFIFTKGREWNEVSCRNAQTGQHMVTMTGAGKSEAVRSLGLDILRAIASESGGQK